MNQCAAPSGTRRRRSSPSPPSSAGSTSQCPRSSRASSQRQPTRVPTSPEQLLEAGLDLLLEKAAKAKGLVARPRKTAPSPKDDGYVPAHVRREVMNRSGGRCEYALPSGERCGSTHRCQFHHVVARAKGGRSIVEN